MTSGIEIIAETIPDQASAAKLIERLYDVAQPAAVFSPPVEHGEYVVITASEATVGIGYGYGGGGGNAVPQVETASASVETATAYGGGGGGAGGAGSRPVAVIEIGPHGVRVEPIVDPTKILLAFFTAFGAMFMMLSRMRREAGG